MTISKINPHILAYIELVESRKIRACGDQILLCAYVRKCFNTQDIYTDNEQLDKYLGLSKYFPFTKLFPWEEFCIALHLCTFWRATGRPRWPDLFLLIGRGAGKDGFIAYESFCLTSPYSKLAQYDVDICATAEDVAMRPVKDIVDVLDSDHFRAKMKKHFYWTAEKVVGLKYRGTIRGRTNNPKSKDGMRSGMVVFNEVHQYEDYKNIKVFISGLGKKKHPRRMYATTDGDVREGPLDDMKATAEMILKGEFDDNGLLPFMCRLNKKDEVHDSSNWEMANPSLRYLPDLMEETEKEYRDWAKNPGQNADFMTKRMNIPQSDAEVAVTDWDNIVATNQPLPDLTGWSCTVGIDFAMLRDWAAVNFHFRKGDLRFDFGRYWICTKNPELSRVKAPWRKWDTCVPVDDVEISPHLLTDYIQETAQQYSVMKVALDNYRYSLMKDALEKIGFDPKERKNVYLVRPSDIMKVQPVIDSCFNNGYFTWGDNPALRWATNNTKLIRSGVKTGNDTGNRVYGKIEAKSRKTDPFIALVASMVIEDELGTGESQYDDLPVIVC